MRTAKTLIRQRGCPGAQADQSLCWVHLVVFVMRRLISNFMVAMGAFGCFVMRRLISNFMVASHASANLEIIYNW